MEDIGFRIPRLESLKTLSEWARRSSRVKLASRLSSAAAHFSQITKEVDRKREELRAPVAESLNAFLTTAKYDDLNFWNIQASSHKAHVQLFKRVKKYKVCGCLGGVSQDSASLLVAPMLEELPKFDTSSWTLKNVEGTVTTQGEEGRIKRAAELANIVAQV